MLFGKKKNNEHQKPIRHKKSFEIKEKIATLNSDWVEYYYVKCEIVSVANFKHLKNIRSYQKLIFPFEQKSR